MFPKFDIFMRFLEKNSNFGPNLMEYQGYWYMNGSFLFLFLEKRYGLVSNSQQCMSLPKPNLSRAYPHHIIRPLKVRAYQYAIQWKRFSISQVLF